LISLFPHTAQVNHAEWLKFCDALTSFIEKPLLLNAFKFDIALIILLLDSLYPTNDTASCTHSWLKHLNTNQSSLLQDKYSSLLATSSQLQLS
jgi:hypothetical protein